MNFLFVLLQISETSGSAGQAIGPDSSNRSLESIGTLAQYLLLIPVIVMVFLVAWKLYSRWIESRYETPFLLFQHLCRVHGLTRSEKRALLTAARIWNVSDPSLLFIDTRLWQADFGSGPFRQPPKRSKVTEHCLASLHSRLMRVTQD